MRMHSESNAHTSCMSCIACMLKSVYTVVYGKKPSTRLQYPCYRKGNCSDIRYESNGIFVLGVGFFLQTNIDFLTSIF